MDLTQSSDPDYLTRCGVKLTHLLLVRPRNGIEAVDLLLELVQSRQVQLVVLDGLSDLGVERAALRHFNRNICGLHRLLHGSGCGVLLLDEPHPPWLRWLGWQASAGVEQWAALHLSLNGSAGCTGRMTGCVVTRPAYVCKRAAGRARRGATDSLGILFNGTVRAARTW